MKIEFTEVLISIGGLLLGIVSYFLINIHKDFKDSISENQEYRRETNEKLGVLKGKIELTEQKHTIKYAQIEEQTQLKIQNLTDNVNRLTNTIEKLLIQNEKSH